MDAVVEVDQVPSLSDFNEIISTAFSNLTNYEKKSLEIILSLYHSVEGL